MAGLVGVSSTRLVGKLVGMDVSFLVDLDATHNFINPSTVRRLGLSLQDMQILEVEWPMVRRWWENFVVKLPRL